MIAQSFNDDYTASKEDNQQSVHYRKEVFSAYVNDMSQEGQEDFSSLKNA